MYMYIRIYIYICIQESGPLPSVPALPGSSKTREAGPARTPPQEPRERISSRKPIKEDLMKINKIQKEMRINKNGNKKQRNESKGF